MILSSGTGQGVNLTNPCTAEQQQSAPETKDYRTNEAGWLFQSFTFRPPPILTAAETTWAKTFSDALLRRNITLIFAPIPPKPIVEAVASGIDAVSFQQAYLVDDHMHDDGYSPKW